MVLGTVVVAKTWKKLGIFLKKVYLGGYLVLQIPEIGLHHVCLDSEQNVSCSGEASNRASPCNFQGGGVHN